MCVCLCVFVLVGVCVRVPVCMHILSLPRVQRSLPDRPNVGGREVRGLPESVFGPGPRGDPIPMAAALTETRGGGCGWWVGGCTVTIRLRRLEGEGPGRASSSESPTTTTLRFPRSVVSPSGSSVSISVSRGVGGGGIMPASSSVG